MDVMSKYKEWWDSDNGDIYQTQERNVTNQFPVIVVITCDAGC